MYVGVGVYSYMSYAYIWKPSEEKVEEDRKVNESIYITALNYIYVVRGPGANQ